DDYLVWYDIPVGSKRRYPDFIILHPSRGLLFLEVKDWKPDSLKTMNKSSVTLLTQNGMVTKPHPLEQVREYAYQVVNLLVRDPQLRQEAERYRGNLCMPYGWGVVFSNITRRQIEKGMPEAVRETLLPDHLTIYKDEMTESADAERFQEQLWGMFNHRFGGKLALPQIDRVRWHLFPEIRIEGGKQGDLFVTEDDAAEAQQALPNIIRIMDLQQEQLARSLGEGHRVIHGVAGSGKTMILGYRCLYLAQAMSKPILVLCFNITLAARLRAFISSKGIDHRVQIYHFHDWCAQQLRTYHVDLPRSGKPVFERQVEAVIEAVDKGYIPRGQYGALLIDEGHDFEPEWLKLVVQMVDPDSNTLLMLYDDAQSIYKKQSGLGFSLSSVGIQAQGRTTVLRLNYRNTREILDFAYSFAKDYLDVHDADEDHVPLIEPEAAGVSGPVPQVRRFSSLAEEVAYVQTCLQRWHEKDVAWGDMAILYAYGWQGEQVARGLEQVGIPYNWLADRDSKRDYDPGDDRVVVLTMHSSKGLEFPRVVMVGIGQMKDEAEQLQRGARVLYVGMTRAQECLLVTSSGENAYSRRLLELATG
ncbi:MAG: 3'-5' exonuclease, partial [Thiohalomonadaceae bacterium]